MNDRYDRDTILIRDKRIPHHTAQRDWVCICGSKLVTRWFEDAPHWRTVCCSDETHDPDSSFVHHTTWAWLEHKRLTEMAQADDVFTHLPEELQAAILASP